MPPRSSRRAVPDVNGAARRPEMHKAAAGSPQPQHSGLGADDGPGTLLRSVTEDVVGGVLGLVAGLLDVGLGLLGLALRLEALVAGGLAGGLLDLSDRFFASVLDLVAHGHDVPSFLCSLLAFTSS